MRCSNTTCGVEGTWKVCKECGHKMVETPQTNKVVICTGKREDGSSCQSELVPGQRFCIDCGVKVDQILFNIDQEYFSSFDRRLVDTVLEKQELIDVHNRIVFRSPVDIGKAEHLNTHTPRLCPFSVSQLASNMVTKLHVYTTSNLFWKLWTDQSHVCDQRATTEDVVQRVWLPVKRRLDKISDQIKTGEIKIRDFEAFIGRMYGDDSVKMREEMLNLEITDKDITERLDQLRKCRQLNDCVKGAKIILKFAQENELSGDFDHIKIIARHGENDLEMRSFDDTMMNTCNFLKEMTPKREACLQMFVSCRPLVQWLKESMMKSGLKELKVLVDLAFMSAGGDPLNIARVQCLHSAVTGYAPLIFDLEKNSGYKELLKHCSVVWKELEDNAKLPDKLKDTNRQLQWLKEIKKAHGSVEVTSLMQAEAINASSIFTVGKSAWRKGEVTVKTEETLIVGFFTSPLSVPLVRGMDIGLHLEVCPSTRLFVCRNWTL